MTLRELLTDGGRKYAVVISTLRYGFLLAALGLITAAVVPTIAIHVAEIVGSFGFLGGVAIAAYQISNALGDKWNPTQGVPPVVGGARAPDAPPAPRQSGMVPEPGVSS